MDTNIAYQTNRKRKRRNLEVLLYRLALAYYLYHKDDIEFEELREILAKIDDLKAGDQLDQGDMETFRASIKGLYATFLKQVNHPTYSRQAVNDSCIKMRLQQVHTKSTDLTPLPTSPADHQGCCWSSKVLLFIKGVAVHQGHC